MGFFLAYSYMYMTYLIISVFPHHPLFPTLLPSPSKMLSRKRLCSSNSVHAILLLECLSHCGDCCWCLFILSLWLNISHFVACIYLFFMYVFIYWSSSQIPHFLASLFFHNTSNRAFTTLCGIFINKWQQHSFGCSNG